MPYYVYCSAIIICIVSTVDPNLNYNSNKINHPFAMIPEDKNKANLRDLIAATGLVILLK